MLVRLYALPQAGPALAAAAGHGVGVRRALVLERPRVLDWVAKAYPSWAAETEAAFARQPVSCMIAVRDGRIVGFACYDALFRDVFGPMAVAEEARGLGIGRALLLAVLHALKEQGYAYAVIGGAGPAEFYRRCAGAVPIEGSEPGPYAGLLRG
jgi:GNAT superfamily N-acetyltransferase